MCLPAFAFNRLVTALSNNFGHFLRRLTFARASLHSSMIFLIHRKTGKILVEMLTLNRLDSIAIVLLLQDLKKK
jgi:hypothetical protein